jgi:hypothetical protein
VNSFVEEVHSFTAGAQEYAASTPQQCEPMNDNCALIMAVIVEQWRGMFNNGGEAKQWRICRYMICSRALAVLDDDDQHQRFDFG